MIFMDRNLEFSRAVFAERALENAVMLGAEQYVIFRPHTNRFAYKKPHWAENLRVFEVDSLDRIHEKVHKLEREGIEVPKNVYYVEGDFRDKSWKDTLCSCGAYRSDGETVVNLYEITQCVGRPVFESLLRTIYEATGEGSAIIFDYIDESMGYIGRAYSEYAIEGILSQCGFRLYEHVNAEEMRQQYLRFYNLFSSNPPIIPPVGMNYCLAVKK